MFHRSTATSISYPYIDKRKKRIKRIEAKKTEKRLSMTKEETVRILQLLGSEFPLSYKSLDEEQQRMKAKLWHDTFEKIPSSIVTQAVTEEIIDAHSGFAPTIGQVINRIIRKITPDPDEHAQEAWEKVLSFVRNYGVDEYRDHYLELPENVRKCVSLPDLMAISYNSQEQNHNFEKPRFLNQFKAIQERYETQMIAAGRIDLLADPGKIKQITGGKTK